MISSLKFYLSLSVFLKKFRFLTGLSSIKPKASQLVRLLLKVLKLPTTLNLQRENTLNRMTGKMLYSVSVMTQLNQSIN